MSRATEWAAEIQRAKDLLDEAKRQQRPEAFALNVSARDKFWFAVEEDGSPRLTTPDARIGYQVDPGHLIALAHWILDTFGERR